MKKFLFLCALASLFILSACTTDTNSTVSTKTNICTLINTADGESVIGSTFTTKEHDSLPENDPVNGVYTTDCSFKGNTVKNSVNVIARLGENADSMKAEFESSRKQLEEPGMSGEGRKPETVAGVGDQAHWTPAKGIVPGSLAVLKGKNILYLTLDGFGSDNKVMLEKAKTFAVKMLEKL